MLLFVIKVYLMKISAEITVICVTRITKVNKKRRNATKTRFSMIQPSIDMTGIRNERWQ